MTDDTPILTTPKPIFRILPKGEGAKRDIDTTKISARRLRRARKKVVRQWDAGKWRQETDPQLLPPA